MVNSAQQVKFELNTYLILQQTTVLYSRFVYEMLLSYIFLSKAKVFKHVLEKFRVLKLYKYSDVLIMKVFVH